MNIQLTWPKETIGLDPDQLCELYLRLGAGKAESLICDAVDELVVALSKCEGRFFAADWDGLYEQALVLQEKSTWLGLCKLARIASDIRGLIERADRVALAAVMSRLSRVGERSIMTVWEAQDI